MNAKAIGERIKKLREGLGQSKKFVAQQLGVSYSALCQWEWGIMVPGDAMKVKIAAYFNTTVEAIFFADE